MFMLSPYFIFVAEASPYIVAIYTKKMLFQIRLPAPYDNPKIIPNANPPESVIGSLYVHAYTF